MGLDLSNNVPGGRLELPWVTPLVPKTSASTNFATPAKTNLHKNFVVTSIFLLKNLATPARHRRASASHKASHALCAQRESNPRPSP